MMELAHLAPLNAKLAFRPLDARLALQVSQRKKTQFPLLVDLSVLPATLLAKLA